MKAQIFFPAKTFFIWGEKINLKHYPFYFLTIIIIIIILEAKQKPI